MSSVTDPTFETYFYRPRTQQFSRECWFTVLFRAVTRAILIWGFILGYKTTNLRNKLLFCKAQQQAYLTPPTPLAINRVRTKIFRVPAAIDVGCGHPSNSQPGKLVTIIDLLDSPPKVNEKIKAPGVIPYPPPPGAIFY